MDKYRIDSHKLLYHPDRVHAWQRGELIYPVYMEASPSGACNHRCTYCALDFMEYQRRFLDTAVFKERLTELGQLGLRSIMYAGEGEPFLHPEFVELVRQTKQAGIDTAITTNGVLFKQEHAAEVLAHTAWIKVSINGATPKTYAQIHRTREDDFFRVIENMSHAADVRAKEAHACALGMQLLLLPENIQEAVMLAKRARDIGMDYLVIKPYSQHPLSKTQLYKDVRYETFLPLAEELTKYNTDRFQVIFRLETMQQWDEGEHRYGRCLALPFWSYIDAGGNVWGCSMFLGDERFLYGNIYEQTFEAIWTGEKRAASLQWMQEHWDTGQCRVNCRMDKINQYLWELRHPPEHVNFI